MKTLMITLCLVFLSACSQKSSDLDAIESKCQSNKDENDTFCECLVTHAEDELTEEQIAFIAAGFEEDQDRIEEIKQQLGMQGIVETGVFMAKLVTVCAINKE